MCVCVLNIIFYDQILQYRVYVYSSYVEQIDKIVELHILSIKTHSTLGFINVLQNSSSSINIFKKIEYSFRN